MFKDDVVFKDEVIMHHFIIHCNLDQRVWSVFLNMFDMQWVMPCRVANLFHQWQVGTNYVQGKIL